MKEDEKVEKPIMEELAEPEDIFGSGVLSNGSKYTQLLISQDTVLAQKGRDYKVYREVLRDDQCKSCFGQRRDALLSAPWEVEPASEASADVAVADFIREMVNALDWDRITGGMHYGIWYGHAIGECMWELRDGKIWLADVRVRDRRRFGYDREGGLHLNKSTGWVQMPERKFWVFNTGADHDDEPYGLGLAHWCYWLVFFKRNDIKWWLVFQEKFACPTIKGTAPAGVFKDESLRNEVLAQLRKFATDSAILAPDGVVVELLEAARSGASSYAELCEKMDDAIAKVILSQTMTTDNGSSRSQAEVHEGVRDMVVKSDSDLICRSFAQVVRWLVDWNFGTHVKAPRLWRIVTPPEDLNVRAERDAKIYGLGYEPTEEYITNTYGEGWQKRAVENGLTPQEVAAQAAAEFAELGVLAAAKGAHRMDQQEIVDAAKRFAAKHPQILGKRVKQLVDFAETSSDYETFRRNLLGLMKEAAPTEITDPVVRSGILARLLGRFRNQRN